MQVVDGRLAAWLRTEIGADGTAMWRDQWDTMFQRAIAQSGSAQLDQLDKVITAWTGLENSARQVAEWIDVTMERIRGLQPRRVLEIGCGTGQILTRLAPSTEAYWAADISNVAIEALKENVTLPQVSLLCRGADDFSGIPDAFFDTVIINSVAQYFPSAQYLHRVLIGTARKLRAGGRIFLGDIQGRALLPVHHAEALLARATAGMTCGEFREKVAQRVARETELSLDPAWFELLDLPDLTHVEILLRRGKLNNETTDYHYDVILHFGNSPATHAVSEWRKWPGAGELQTLLSGLTSCLAISRIPDARLASQIGFFHALEASASDAPLPLLPDVSAAAVSAEQLFAIADDACCRAHVRWHGDGTDGLMDAVFLPTSDTALPAWPRPAPSSALANVPWQHGAEREQNDLFESLRRELGEKLPDYMIPAIFLKVDAFPLTPNGKVDRKALAAMRETAVASPMSTSFVAPSGKEEIMLADIWRQVLGVERIGVNDDIFELGGDSIFIFQITARANRAGLAISPAQVFRHRTIAELVRQGAAAEKPKAESTPSIKRLDRNAYRRKS